MRTTSTPNATQLKKHKRLQKISKKFLMRVKQAWQRSTYELLYHFTHEVFQALHTHKASRAGEGRKRVVTQRKPVRPVAPARKVAKSGLRREPERKAPARQGD